MELGKLYLALSKAQGALTSAGKTGYNPHFKSGYADLHGIWETIRQPLVDNELCVLQTIEMEEGKYVLVTTLGHSSGQAITSRLPLTPKDQTSQAYGSAISYARRYSLMALMGVSVSDDKEDDDGEAANGRGKDAHLPKNSEPSPFVDKPKPILTVTAIEADTILKSIGDDEEYKNTLLDFYKIKSFFQLPSERYKGIITAITKHNEERLKTEMAKV